MALDLAARGLVRGAVAVAPLLDGLRAVLPPLGRLLLPWRRAATAVPPPDAGHAYFARSPEEQRATLRAGLRPEPAAWLRELERLATPAAPAVPALLVAQQADEVASQLFVEICARGIEADFARFPGGHWPMLEARVDDWITPLHRWIIKRVGHGLLVLRGDEDLVEP
jgi:pimeloyl-ACP methyl ester carboxylesterase